MNGMQRRITTQHANLEGQLPVQIGLAESNQLGRERTGERGNEWNCKSIMIFEERIITRELVHIGVMPFAKNSIAPAVKQNNNKLTTINTVGAPPRFYI